MTRTPHQSSALLAAALLAAGALGAWQARRVADLLWPTQEQRAKDRRPSPAGGPTGGAPPILGRAGSVGSTPAGRPAGPGPVASGDDAGASGATGGSAEPPTEAERAAAQQLVGGLQRLARDLEFNAGLPEPPQQVVRPAPTPWRPAGGEQVQPPPVIEEVEPRAGPASGGTRVTLRGRHLRVAQVMFGPSPADIVSVSPEAVTVVAPAGGAGPVVIALTNDDGSFAVAGAPFTYGR